MLLVVAATYGVVNSQSANGVYDTDGDGLIEIEYLEQLDAMRYDLNGDGWPDEDAGAEAWAEAFPTVGQERVCNRKCDGYELVRSLDFDDPDSYASNKVNTAWTASRGWLPVGYTDYQFEANFDGNGHVISNLYINRTPPLQGESLVGLWGSVGWRSLIREVGLVDVDVTGKRYIGGMVGLNNGDITASYITGKVSGEGDIIGGLTGDNTGTITSTYTAVDVSGSLLVGGLVGWNTGSAVIIASYATGDVSSNHEGGGLIGGNASTITIINSYATGKITGDESLGGLMGRNTVGSTIVGSFWDRQSTGLKNGAGRGLET